MVVIIIIAIPIAIIIVVLITLVLRTIIIIRSTPSAFSRVFCHSQRRPVKSIYTAIPYHSIRNGRNLEIQMARVSSDPRNLNSDVVTISE